MIKVLVTSGGTRSYIDPVRVLTNISTGKLGQVMVETLSRVGIYDIYHVYAKGSLTADFTSPYYHKHEISTCEEAMAAIMNYVPNMDIVIHSMAVSDFGFKPTDEKLASNSPEDFINSLKSRIYKNPKILPLIKQLNPNCILFSFKFENGISTGQLIDIATRSMIKSNSDVVIANDKAEMEKEKTHVSYFISKEKLERIDGKENIALHIIEIIKNKINGK